MSSARRFVRALAFVSAAVVLGSVGCGGDDDCRCAVPYTSTGSLEGFGDFDANLSVDNSVGGVHLVFNGGRRLDGGPPGGSGGFGGSILPSNADFIVTDTGPTIVYHPTDDWEWIYRTRGTVRVVSEQWLIRDFEYTPLPSGRYAIEATAVAPDDIDGTTHTFRVPPRRFTMQGQLAGPCTRPATCAVLTRD